MTGEICTDNVQIGNLVIPQQHFAEITDEDEDWFIDAKFSGIMGLGFNPLSAEGTSPVFDRIVSSQQIDWNVLSFYYSLRRCGPSDVYVDIHAAAKIYVRCLSKFISNHIYKLLNVLTKQHTVHSLVKHPLQVAILSVQMFDEAQKHAQIDSEETVIRCVNIG